MDGGICVRIILSPAKKMREDTDSLAPKGQPVFLDRAGELLERLRAMPYHQLKGLLACSDAIARLNYRRYQQMDLARGWTPALLAYEGIQYQYMAPGVFTWQEFDYIQEHLRILSGFYGLLRPFDGVVPYRLEMQAKLQIGACRNLYEYWGSCLARALEAEGDAVLNLASEEYSRAVTRHLRQGTRCITPVFAEWEAGRLKEKGVYVKMARGEMVRFLAEGQVEDWEKLKDFDALGYRFQPSLSDRNTYVFARQKQKAAPQWPEKEQTPVEKEIIIT